MHTNEQLIAKLFEKLTARKPNEVADCYHEKATFRDIAFNLKGKEQIRAMWNLACLENKERVESDLEAIVKEIKANDKAGSAIVVYYYTYRDKNRKVVNLIASHFTFQDSKIITQVDYCDPVCWARYALGGFGGWLAGHIAPIRRFKAMMKLKNSSNGVLSLQDCLASCIVMLPRQSQLQKVIDGQTA